MGSWPYFLWLPNVTLGHGAMLSMVFQVLHGLLMELASSTGLINQWYKTITNISAMPCASHSASLSHARH